MKKVVSNILILLAAVLFLMPRIATDMEINKTEQILTQGWHKVEDVEGVLIIDKIDLQLPIKHGATHENMLHSVATMTHKQPKEGKNFTIAGHRNLRKGRNFNRLDEVMVGDMIDVVNYTGKHRYVVDDVFIVYPEQTEILADAGDTEITLITCYPIAVSDRRLVVKGRHIETIREEF